MSEINKNRVFILSVLCIGILLWIFGTLNAMFIFWGIFTGFMFFNITLSTMTNVLTGSMVRANDTLWRLILIFLSSLFITLGIII